MYFPCRRLVFPSCSKCRSFTSSLFNLWCPADNLLISHFVSLSFWGASCLSSCAMFSPCSWNAHYWDDFPPLALKPPFLLLSFFQWNPTTSLSCKILCCLSHLACPLLSVWECTADETPVSRQLLPKFQTFTHFCLLLLFRMVFQQIIFFKSLLILNNRTFFIMPTGKLTMVKQEIQWNFKLVFPLCLPVFSSFPFHRGWLACLTLWRLVLLEGNHCFFFQSYFLSNVK